MARGDRCRTRDWRRRYWRVDEGLWLTNATRSGRATFCRSEYQIWHHHVSRQRRHRTTYIHHYVCRREHSTYEDPLVVVDFNGSIGNDDVRDESLHAVLCRVANELFSQQPRNTFSPRGNEKRQALLTHDGALQVARSGQDVPILLEGRSVILKRPCQEAVVAIKS